MADTFKIEGLSDLEKALGDLPKATGKNVLRRVALAALAPVAEDMRQNAPEDDDAPAGRTKLKDDIHVTTRRPKGGQSEPRQSEVEAFAGPGRHPKAVQQEFGNERHGPQPYVRPAWDNNRDNMMIDVADGLGAEIAKAAERMARKQARLLKGRG